MLVLIWSLWSAVSESRSDCHRRAKNSLHAAQEHLGGVRCHLHQLSVARVLYRNMMNHISLLPVKT